MGIQGLTTLMENQFSGWERKQVNGRLVFDGYSVCHQIHEDNSSQISWSHGGQYGQFRTATLGFIDCLLHSGISPVFVFDGIDHKQQKAKVILKRRKEWIDCIRESLTGSAKKRPYGVRILPLLAIEVFQDALNEKDIPCFYFDGEADPDTVALANHYGCPVVSSDSDFYMFNLRNGFIPLSHFRWTSKPIEADFYYTHHFLRVFKLAPDLCLAVPAIMGTDFIHNLMYNPFKDEIRGGRKGSMIGLVMEYLARFESLNHLLWHIDNLKGSYRYSCRDRLEYNYKKAAEFYLVTHLVTEDKLMVETELRFPDSTRLPKCVLNQYRVGKFAPSLIESMVLRSNFLRIVPDDPHRETAQYCSRPIRQAMYGILEKAHTHVEETVRRQSDLVREPVGRVFVAEDTRLPSIHSVECQSIEERESALHAILGGSMVARIERRWQLVVAASCYWVKMVKPSLPLIKALVLNFVKCFHGQYSPPSSFRHEENPTAKWMESFHCFAQWQCVYLDAMKLNNALLNPLLNVSPAFLFDGEMVMHYALCSDLDRIVLKELDAPRQKGLYDILLSAISADRPVPVKKKSQATKPRSTKPPAASRPAAARSGVANRFALLTVDDSESETDD